MKSSRSIKTSSTFTGIFINPVTIDIICITYIWQLLLQVWVRTHVQYGAQTCILIQLWDFSLLLYYSVNNSLNTILIYTSAQRTLPCHMWTLLKRGAVITYSALVVKKHCSCRRQKEQHWNHPSYNSDLIMYGFVLISQEPVLICYYSAKSTHLKIQVQQKGSPLL
jgi:hypothetical protein